MARKPAQPADAQLALFDVDALDRVSRTPRTPPGGCAVATTHTGVEPGHDPNAARLMHESSHSSSLLSPEDVARRCGLSRKAVYRAVGRGELRAARIVSRLRIDPRDVEAWVGANVVGAHIPVSPSARSRLPVGRGLRRLLPAP